MKVEKGNLVKVDYTGKYESGEVFDSSVHGDHSHPLKFIAGEGRVVKGFDDAVIGMEVGEEKTIKISPEEAYGNFRSELIHKVPKKEFGDKASLLKEGMTLALPLPDGRQIPAKIVKIVDDEIELDLNHPLAGKTLIFDLKIVDVKSADDESSDEEFDEEHSHEH